MDRAELNVNIASSLGLTPDDVFYLITRQDTGSYGGHFAGLSEGATITVGEYFADITYLANWTGTQSGSTTFGGNDVALFNFRVIPEPSTLALTLLGLAAAFLSRRR